MAFNGTGTYVRAMNWATDKSNSVAVTASRMDTEDDGFATGLSTCIAKDGQTTTTARIPFTLGIGMGTGSVSAPAVNASSDTNTGMYFPSADNLGFACGGSSILALNTTGISVTGVLIVSSNALVSGSASVTGGLTVGTDSTFSANLAVLGTLTSTGAITASSGATVVGTLGITGTMVTTSNVTVGGALVVTGGINAGTDVSFAANAGVTGILTVGGATSISGAATFPGIGTSASAANAVFTGGSNTLLKSTSSAKYKTDIRDIDLQEALRIVQGARPIKYHSLAQADDPKREHLGLIAEELAEVDPRLIHFDGDGLPDGVQYERSVVALLSVVKALSVRAGL